MPIFSIMRNKLFLSLLFSSLTLSTFAQDDYDYDEDEEIEDSTRFSFGINFGGYFSNDKTAEIYSGRPQLTPFGIPFILNQQIYRQVFVDYFKYEFEVAEYPLEPKYRAATEMGVHAEYDLNDAIDIYLDFNIAQLRFEQVFTVAIDDPSNGIVGPTYEQLPIFGRENRFHLNLGTQFTLSRSEYSNSYISVFGQLNNVQMRANYIVIDNQEYNIFHRAYDRPEQRLGGIGYGGGTGLGFKYQLTDTFKTDFYYNLSFVQTNMSENLQPYGFNHGIGVRIIWD